MEIVTFFLAAVILIVIIVNHSSLIEKINQLKFDIDQLRYDLKKIGKLQSEEKKDYKPTSESMKQNIAEPSKGMAITKEKGEEIIEKPVIVFESVKINESNIQLPNKAIIQEKTQKIVTKPKLKKNSDIEKFIGENLMSKIGIIILVLGIGFFVKYAIDRNWINEYGRVAIGIFTGGAIITLAHYMRKTYKTFSSILTGGGFAVLYLTIVIAFQLYHMFQYPSPILTFIFLVIITILSVLFSLWYDKKELAIFSQLGGFCVPFMVSTGQDNYVLLFSYLLILNIGLIGIAYFKKWHIVNIIGFIATLILFSIWVANNFIFGSNQPYSGALLFGSLFYLIFFVLNILNNIKERKSFNGIEIGMILSNNLFFFLNGLTILNNFHEGIFRGLFTLIMGIYNLGWLLLLYNRKNIDRTLIYVLIGLVLSFISLSIPIQLNGHSITLFWSAELVILLWLWQKSKISLLKTGSFVILILVIISLFLDWEKIYFNGFADLPIIANRVFITGFVALLAIGITKYKLKNENEADFIPGFLSVKQYDSLLSVLLFTGVYFTIFFELWYQLNRFYDIPSFRQTIYGLYNFTYIAVSVYLSKKQNYTKTLQFFMYVTLTGFIVFILYYLPQIKVSRNVFLYKHQLTAINYGIHYLLYFPVGGLIYFIGKEKESVFGKETGFSTILLWFFVFFIVLVTSIELDNITLTSYSGIMTPVYESDILNQVHKTGYPILWGLLAFILMILGMKYKNKTFRIQSISLLALIILKLFIIDFRSMSQGGKIASFIFLGIVFLIISFLYQKLKVIIHKDKKEEIKHENYD
jgi:uncharacterized membrane protein